MLIHESVKIFTRAADYNRKVEFVLYQGDRDDAAVATAITFVKQEPGSYQEPSFWLDMDAAQKLMDDLWWCGLRPRGAAGSVGQLAAVQAHLGDMQKIGFAALEDVRRMGASQTIGTLGKLQEWLAKLGPERT